MRAREFFPESSENRDIVADIVEYNGLVPLPSLSSYAAVFMLGGPESANDRTKKDAGNNWVCKRDCPV